MRTTWNGTISFGLVNIPVGLAPATKPAARQSDISFRMLHRECGTPIKQKRYCPTHERDLESDEICKGWEVAKGQFVIVEDADLEAVESQQTSKTIEISELVALDEIDPIYFDRTYFLVPNSAPAAQRPYALLLAAMQENGMGALARYVQSGKEKLCLVRTRGNALVLETLFIHEDVYSQAEIEETMELVEVKDAELELARQIISGVTGSFDPATLTSDYRSNLKTMLQAKLGDEEIVAPEEAEEAPIVDLLAALQASVAAAGTAKKPPAAKKKATTPKRKTAASRS